MGGAGDGGCDAVMQAGISQLLLLLLLQCVGHLAAGRAVTHTHTHAHTRRPWLSAAVNSQPAMRITWRDGGSV